METYQDFQQQYLNSVAYHEAAHEAVCIALKIPVQEMGIHIDSQSAGVALTLRRQPDKNGIKRSPEDDWQREQSIILLSAGYIGQVRFYEGADTSGAADDQKHINDLLNEMYQPESDDWINAKSRLRDEAKKMVDEHWAAIEALAKALWAKQWVGRVALPGNQMGWSKDNREKWMDAKEVESVLKRFGLTPIIRSYEAGDYEPEAGT